MSGLYEPCSRHGDLRCGCDRHPSLHVCVWSLVDEGLSECIDCGQVWFHGPSDQELKAEHGTRGAA